MNKLQAKTKGKIILVNIVFMTILLALSQTIMVSGASADFSDSLEYNPYSEFEPALEDQYDGVESFFFEEVGGGQKPSKWIFEAEDNVDYVYDAVGSHDSVMLLDAGGSTAKACFYDLQELDYNKTNDEVFIEFWYRTDDVLLSPMIDVINNITDSKPIFAIENVGNKFSYCLDYSNYDTGVSISTNTWFHISINIINDGTYWTHKVYVNSVLKLTLPLEIASEYSNFNGDWNIERFRYETHPNTKTWIDGLNFNDVDDPIYKKEIFFNEYAEQFDSYEEVSSELLFSSIESLRDIEPTTDNNYREYLITDGYSNQHYIDKNRVLRKTDTDTADTKYKMVQLYFDELDNFKTTHNNGTEIMNAYLPNYNYDIINGSLESSDNLDSVDSNYFELSSESNLNYTSKIPIQSDNFTIYNGTGAFNGSLENTDNDASIFNSSSDGIYDGTYSFTDEIVGTEGTDIEFVDVSGVTDLPIIVDSLEGHDKIIKLEDTLPGNYIHIENQFSTPQDSGTIEFWIYCTDSSKTNGIYLYGSAIALQLKIESGNLYYFSAGYFDIGDIDNNVWYHIRIDFETGSGSYEGLSPDTFHLYLDGVENSDLPFRAVSDSFVDIRIESSGAVGSYSTFLDAVGYSWDSNYDIGDNQFDTKILNFTTVLNLENRFADNAILNYTVRTDNFQTINLSIWNNNLNQFDTINNSIAVNYYENDYQLNSSHFNSTNDILLKFYVFNESSRENVSLYIDKLRVYYESLLSYENSFNLNRTLDEFDYLTNNYSISLFYESNLTKQLVNISVYNFDTSTFDLVSSVNNSKYSLTNTINSDYLGDDLEVLVMFESSNLTNPFLLSVDLFVVNCYKYNINNSGLNQDINVRVDSFDSNNDLMNKYFLDIELNNSSGSITWNVMYKDPNYPLWYNTPTNPIFHFEDYIGDEVLRELQITFHFKLNELDDHIFFDIRTIICFNNYYEMTYQYDKVVDGGWFYGDNDFYDDQVRLNVKYIDYFNYNNYIAEYDMSGTPYFRNETYNNLKGIRTLRTVDTAYYSNFLEVGFFTDRLTILPPSEDEDWEKEDKPTEDLIPDDEFDYYLPYTEYYVGDSITIAHTTGDISILPAGTPIDEWNTPFTEQEVESRERQFGVNKDTFKYRKARHMGTWKMSWGALKLNFNWAREPAAFIVNIFLGIANGAMEVGQLAIWVFWAYFAVFFTYVGCSLWVLIWNIGAQTLFNMAMEGLWYVIAGVAIIIWFFLWLWEEVIVPFFEWFGEWMLTDFIPLMVELFIHVWAWLIALIVCALSGKLDDEEFFNEVYDSVTITLEGAFDYLFETITIVIENFDAVIMSILLYFIFMAYLMFKGWYVKTKGNMQRYEELLASFQAYYLPIDLMFRLYDRLKNSVPMA